MVERMRYVDGEPCWADLVSREPEAFRRFYTAVLGWTYQDQGPEYGDYVICLSNGRPIAGMTPWQPAMGEAPTAWSLYFAAHDVDATVERVTSTGGRLMMDPMDIPQHGRMAFGFDPMGAAFGMWQAAEHLGFGFTGEPGAFSWGELVVPDGGVDRFYQGLFGYEQQQTGNADWDYTTWSVSGSPVCGRMIMPAEMREHGIPPHWQLYFAVADADVAIDQVIQAGGTVAHAPHDTPYGRLAGVADAEGAQFHLIDLSRAESPA